uniref:IgLON family member 5 n=1 Tax=Poecilia reticulata TaxID=8081 RepID=A0A3P9NJW8_POERE
PDNITVLEGESVTLRCQIDEEVTHKAWLNRSNILFTGTDKWSLDKRVTLVNTSNREFSILIDKVQVTDEGPYTCTFQANNKPRITHVYLIVQVPARIVNISKSVSVNEGENVNLYCLAVGRPEPTVTWKDQKCKLLILVFLRSRRTSEVTGTCLKSLKPSECVCSFLRSSLHAAVRLCCTIIFRCRLLYLNRSTDVIFDSPKHELHHLPTQQKTWHFVK